MEHKLDNIDRKIIEMLQKNARHPGKGNRKGSFPLLPSCLRQDRTPRKKRADHRLPCPDQPGISRLSYKSIHQPGSRTQPKKRLLPFIQSIPNVIECNCVTGDYSMLIEVAFRSTMELDHFINELQQFGRTKTQIVFSTSVEHRDPAGGVTPTGIFYKPYHIALPADSEAPRPPYRQTTGNSAFPPSYPAQR